MKANTAAIRAIFLASLFLTAACSPSFSTAPKPATPANRFDFGSPEAAFRSIQRAEASGDFSDFLECIDPRSRESMVKSVLGVSIDLLALAAKLGGNSTEPSISPVAERIKKVFEDHNVTSTTVQEAFDSAENPTSLAEELVPILEALSGAPPEKSIWSRYAGVLENIKVTGNWAEADLVDSQRKRRRKIFFQQTADEWRVALFSGDNRDSTY